MTRNKDFDTDESIEAEMQQMMDKLIIPMRENGDVRMTALLYPDLENCPPEIREQCSETGQAPMMVLPEQPNMDSKEDFYDALSHMTQELKVHNVIFFADSWVLVKERKNMENEIDGYNSVSEHPESKDALMMEYIGTDGQGILMKRAVCTLIYEMKNDKLVEIERKFLIHENDGSIRSAIADAVSNKQWA